MMAGVSLCAYGLDTQEAQWRQVMNHHYQIYNNPAQSLESRVYAAFELSNGYTFGGNEELADYYYNQSVALAHASGRYAEFQECGVV